MAVEEQLEEGVHGRAAIPTPLSKMSSRADRMRGSFQRAEASNAGDFEAVREEGSPAVEPVILTIGQLNVRVTPHSPTQDQVRLIIAVTRSADNTAASGVQLSLEGDEGPLASATTDNNGVAELPLPQGSTKLVFQAPVRAELRISF
jgi:hypothetical protein